MSEDIKLNYIKKISSIINALKIERFTGELVLSLFFNEGGIRGVEKIIKEKIK